MIVTLTGNNSFAIKRKFDELVNEFVAKHGGLALEKIDAEAASEMLVLEAVQSLPFLAERKMVVVRGMSQNKAAMELAEQIISSTSDTTDLIIYEPNVDKRTSYFKVLKNHTQMQEFNEMDSQALINWLTTEAKNHSGELSYADANYLVERVGTSQQFLATELDKLLIFNPKITRASIDLLTEASPQSKVFELLDAAFSGNKKRALELYEEQRVQKIEPQAIMAMIGWQLQMITLASSAGQRTVKQIADDSGNKPYPIEKAKVLAGKLGRAKLSDLVTDALEIDYKSKTRTFQLDEALKNYIVTI